MSEISQKLRAEAEKLPDGPERIAFLKGIEAAKSEAQKEREEQQQREQARLRYARQF